MKKIIIAMTAMVVGAMAQAASFNWASTANAMGADLAALNGNGSVGVGSTTMKAQGSTAWTAVLSLYSDGALVGSSDATVVKWATTGSKFKNNGIEVAAAETGKTYDYVMTITGAPDGLTGALSDSWDYSAATLTTTISGSITTESMGATTLSTGIPTSWTVAGATEKGSGAPEPTSGLLLLLGAAGLALKRKVA